MANKSCPPGNQLLPFNQLTIPGNLTSVFLPTGNTGNTTYQAMESCCAPNPVNLALGCYVWCQVPAGRLHDSVKDAIIHDFGGCLSENGWNISEVNIMGGHIAGEKIDGSTSAASATAVPAAGLVRGSGKGRGRGREGWVWALLVSGAAAVGFASLL